MGYALAFLILCRPTDAGPPGAVPFASAKYGLKVEIPRDWRVAEREVEDRVFAALVPQGDPDRPGVVACELGLAPESLEEYRRRIDDDARGGRGPGRLAKNEVVRGPKGDRLETVHEFRPRGGGLWREVRVRLVAHRQLYTFILNVDDGTYPAARPAFDALVASAAFEPPDTGADLEDAKANRWAQREFRFAIALPEGWAPVRAPTEVALLYANGPARGIWSDNLLVLGREHRALDLPALARDFPDELRRAMPGCEVLACEVVKQGKGEALETVVRTKQGPFSMTILERRFRGDRFDYEVKYTVESKRFDALAPALRASLDGFAEVPGPLPRPPKGRRSA